MLLTYFQFLYFIHFGPVKHIDLHRCEECHFVFQECLLNLELGVRKHCLKKIRWWAGGVAQVVECLPSKCEALKSNPQYNQKISKKIKKVKSDLNEVKEFLEWDFG
jgi:hypothetical protein